MEHDSEILSLPPQPEPAAPTWSLNDVLLITAGAGVLFVLGLAAIQFGLRDLPGGSQELARPSILLSSLLGALEAVALTAPVWLFGVLRNPQGRKAPGLVRPRSQWIWIAVGLSAVAIPVSGLIASLIQMALRLPQENPQLPFLIPQGFSWVGLVSMVLLGGVAAPFAEELFFRGVLYQWLRQRWGFWAGLIVSSVIFGALHGDLVVGGVAALLGALLAWIYERSHSLWPAVVIHVLNNGIKILLLYGLVAAGVKVF